MFKRANKITALLVAAASVMSVVPAMASDYKKVDSKDGIIYDAVAYKDGTALVDGEVEDNDGVYYVADGKYTELEDVDTGSEYATYGSKYVTVDENSYYVDLTDGKVTDDSVADDNADDAAMALRKAIKGEADDRYNDDADLKTDLTVLEGTKFGETWYETKYTTEAGVSVAVYTDAKGNYIDADYNLGKIKVKTTDAAVTNTKTKAVNIENTKDTYEGALAKDEVSASLSDRTVIGQDKDYIYRKATITIDAGTSTIETINGVDLVAAADAFTKTNDGKIVSFKVIQKISKAQASDDVDGAKYAKSVTNYVISDDGGDAKTLLAGANFTVADGKVIAYTFDEDDDKVTAQTIVLDTSKGFYYTDIKGSADRDATAVDTDVDGNLWALDSGSIYKFNNDEDWDKVYKTDGAIDELSVYDKNNIIAWNESDEVFAAIGGKSTTDTTPVTPVTPVGTTGWAQAVDGTWSYNKADGTKTTGWFQDTTGTWYYATAEGTMVANGWVQYGSTWYYLGASGAMATNAWIQYGSDWYYVGGTGAMLANTTVDGYVLGASGAWVR